ncbi:MAG: hypothetical protein K0R71_2007 [Bacillales bacterium]|jgi:DNA integrity scanning protein DisA with diadenylate cyclase activity|nr:hypothetical protein [Bacillales bacterium]
MNQYELLLGRLAKPAQRAIQNAQLKSLEDISALSEIEFSNLHGIGKNAIRAVKEILSENKLQFKKD